MKIRFIRADLIVSAEFDTPANAEKIDDSSGVPHWKVGAVIDETLFATQILVGNGDAEPADEEAEAACPQFADKKKRADILLSREMLAKGIEPEDRERFRAGEILGYDENGKDIPGPNWPGETEQEEAE